MGIAIPVRAASSEFLARSVDCRGRANGPLIEDALVVARLLEAVPRREWVRVEAAS